MNGKIAVMQPYFFPYIGYFQLMNSVDKFVIYDDVNFINRGWIHRNKILINNKENLFTIPLKKASQNKLINEIELSDSENWKSKFLKTLVHNYRKAPFFEEIYNMISDIVNSKETQVSKLIFKSLIEVKYYLNFETDIIETSSIYNNTYLKGTERIIDICNKENSNHYINLIGGLELYSKDVFNSYNIKLNFIKSNEIRYKQFNDNFIDSLSIIDVLMFNPKDQIRNYMNEYELI